MKTLAEKLAERKPKSFKETLGEYRPGGADLRFIDESSSDGKTPERYKKMTEKKGRLYYQLTTGGKA